MFLLKSAARVLQTHVFSLPSKIPCEFSTLSYEDVLHQHKVNQINTELSRQPLNEQVKIFQQVLISAKGQPLIGKVFESAIIHGEVAIQNSVKENNYGLALECSEHLEEHLQQSNDHRPYLILLRVSMAMYHLQQGNREKGLVRLVQAETLLLQELTTEKVDLYAHHLKSLSGALSDFGLIDKCINVASILVNLPSISWEFKVVTMIDLINSLTTLQKFDEAIQVAENFISEVSFVGLTDADTESVDLSSIDALTEVYRSLIELLVDQNKVDSAQQSYYLQDELLCLAEIEARHTGELFKRTAIFDWKKEQMYSLLMICGPEKIREILTVGETRKRQKLSSSTQLSEKDLEEVNTKVKEQGDVLAEEYVKIKEVIELQKNAERIADLLKDFDQSESLRSSIGEEFVSLAEKCLVIEKSLIHTPIIDQYFISSTFFDIKDRLTNTEQQERVIRALDEKQKS